MNVKMMMKKYEPMDNTPGIYYLRCGWLFGLFIIIIKEICAKAPNCKLNDCVLCEFDVLEWFIVNSQLKNRFMDGPRTRQHISFELEHNLMGLKKLKLESKTKKKKEKKTMLQQNTKIFIIKVYSGDENQDFVHNLVTFLLHWFVSTCEK